LLIPALAASTASDPSLHLVMAGPDSSRWAAELKAAARMSGVANRIHWPGMLKGDAKWGAFAASEAFILPSHQENFGIAIVEALACGKPVLITKPINIAPQIAIDGCGLIEDDTIHGTTMLIERWIKHTNVEHEQMSIRAKESFAARYDMQRNTAKLLNAFAPVATEQTQELAEVRRA
jgi:glycosyltransferase involved in cell wall biosynthesis